VAERETKVWWKRQWILILGGILLVGGIFGDSADTDGDASTATPDSESTPVSSTSDAPITAAPTTATQSAISPTSPPTTAEPLQTPTIEIGDKWTISFLGHLKVDDSTPNNAYDRSGWGAGWADDDADCVNTRHEVLIIESIVEAEMDSSGCKVISGKWFAAFTRTYVDDPSSLDIDHFVPLANAHTSGGWAWSPDTKRNYYNDLTDPQHLIAVTASANRSKGAKGPHEWKPTDKSYWCQYAYTWADIKTRWQLSVTSAELIALEMMLNTCNGQPSSPPAPPVTHASRPSTNLPTSTTAATTTTAPERPLNPGDSMNCSNFNNYAQAKEWFDTYFAHYGDVARLDRDSDLIPCEALPGSP